MSHPLNGSRREVLAADGPRAAVRFFEAILRLAHRGGSGEEETRHLLSHVLERMGADVAALYLWDAEVATAYPATVHGTGADTPDVRRRLDAGVERSLALSSGGELEDAADEGAFALLVVEGETVGALAVLGAEPESGAQIADFESVASHFAAVILRVRAMKHARSQQRRAAAAREGLESVLRDLRERQETIERINAELLHVRSSLEEHTLKLASIGQLAVGVAHEINNPAASALLNLTVALQHINTAISQEALARAHPRPCPSEDRRESDPPLIALRGCLDDALDAIERIRTITRNLSAFSRYESESIELVQMDEVVRSAVRIVHHQLAHRARFVFDSQPLPSFAGERVKLTQVVTNLLINAAQAIPAGDAEQNCIRVELRRVRDVVVLAVEDTGRGIPAANLALVFEAFYTTKAPEEGTGLGLHVSLEIARRHRGALTATSEVGTGSRFELHIPLETGMQVGLPEAQPAPPSSKRYRARVLIIDDDDMLCRAYRRLLKPHHDVTTASSGEEALALLARDSNFDIVLCDLMMPGIDGVGVYAELQAQGSDLLDRIVFCTGGAFTADVKARVSSLNNTLLEKPVPPRLILDTIDAIVAGATLSS